MLPTLTPALMRQLVKVNEDVNALPYETDSQQYGQAEFWQEIGITGRGDCEDYSLEKQRRLRALGWPQEALRLAVCLDEDGEGHCVLTVDTTSSTYVLDNRDLVVRPWRDLPYKWLARQAPTGRGWVQITEA